LYGRTLAADCVEYGGGGRGGGGVAGAGQMTYEHQGCKMPVSIPVIDRGSLSDIVPRSSRGLNSSDSTIMVWHPESQSTTLTLLGQAKFYHKASPRPRALCKPALVGLEESGRFASESASRRISKRAAHRLGLAGRRGRRSSAFPGLLRRCTADACPEPGRRGVCKSAAIEYNWSTTDTVITIERMATSTLRSKVAAL
jgi:hypothetical protein